MSASDELLPCPFCGDRVALCFVSASEEWASFNEDEPFPHSESWHIVCDASHPFNGCGASAGFEPTKDAAAAAWNRRWHA